MKFVTTNWSLQVKDIWQQPLHFLGGACIVMLPSIVYTPLWPLYLAISVSYGIWREYKQHAPVCVDIDSCCWTAGALVALSGVIL